MKVISTKKAPAAIGPYSQAIQVGKYEQRLCRILHRAISCPFSCCSQDIAEGSIGRNRSHSRDMKLKKRKIKYCAIFFICWFAFLAFLVDG